MHKALEFIILFINLNLNRMKASEVLLEVAKQRYPKSTDEVLLDQTLAVFGISNLQKALTAQSFAGAEQIVEMSHAITLGELDDAIQNFPALTRTQVLRFFSREAMASETVKMDSSYITRPALISFVERLEDYTGLKMTDNTDAPLAYLDKQDGNLTVGDIADFFSRAPDNKIQKLITGEYPNNSPRGRNLDRDLVKQYLMECVSDKSLDEKAPITTLASDFHHGQNDYYVVVHWLENRFSKMVPNSFVESKTIGELIDYLSE